MIKKLKYKDETAILDEWIINDNYTLAGEEDIEKQIQAIETVTDKDTTEWKWASISLWDTSSSSEKDVTLNDNTQKILAMFEEYSLKQMMIHGSLFDLTTEYPDEYLEYLSEDVTLYFFPTKKYTEVVDIFFAISQGLPFSINKSNNFWEQSFFINLNKEFQDEYVRIVIESKKDVFWLKIKKDVYNAIKPKLSILKK